MTRCVFTCSLLLTLSLSVFHSASFDLYLCIPCCRSLSIAMSFSPYVCSPLPFFLRYSIRFSLSLSAHISICLCPFFSTFRFLPSSRSSVLPFSLLSSIRPIFLYLSFFSSLLYVCLCVPLLPHSSTYLSLNCEPFVNVLLAVHIWRCSTHSAISTKPISPLS